MNSISNTSSIKRIASTILAFLLFALSSNAQIGLQSDLNHDKKVNVSDVSLLLSLIMNHVTDAAVEAGLCPNAMHPHLIDLGLPSGTKWACCNVGADYPFQYGDYYSWGEMATKIDYYNHNSLFYNSGDDSWLSLGDDIAQTNWDVAYLKWGTDYRMPSHAQIQELVENCTSTWTTFNKVNGRLFTAQNGNKVFLPAAGHRWNDYFYDAGSGGYYWSSTQDPSNSSSAYGLVFYSGSANYNRIYGRFYGRSVRPVSAVFH